MISMSTCHRNNLCVDCDDDKCLHAGDPMADCPKYHCDNDVVGDCENCEFLKNYTNEYKKNLESNSGGTKNEHEQ